ncbi:unnamed protein product [Heligmosomoides polygyrus]|uniref:PSCyt2 domain-containing protein n=1 Tax=Heligmosomoides polygyrus TaxID=6339 RepID=A0A183FF05_HELPZ|nr:unnamed protein product [Heligmosomoides polygyrus]
MLVLHTWVPFESTLFDASAMPTHAGKTPPSLEEFDPLNPGELQLGASGKILPRLPGAKVGKLVMDQYGLYDPHLRKRVEVYSKALLEGKNSEDGFIYPALTRMVKQFVSRGYSSEPTTSLRSPVESFFRPTLN